MQEMLRRDAIRAFFDHHAGRRSRFAFDNAAARVGTNNMPTKRRRRAPRQRKYLPFMTLRRLTHSPSLAIRRPDDAAADMTPYADATRKPRAPPRGTGADCHNRQPTGSIPTCAPAAARGGKAPRFQMRVRGDFKHVSLCLRRRAGRRFPPRHFCKQSPRSMLRREHARARRRCVRASAP